MENEWNGGGEGKARYNMEMILMRDTGALNYSVHGGDREKWTDLKNLQRQNL